MGEAFAPSPAPRTGRPWAFGGNAPDTLATRAADGVAAQPRVT